MTLPIEVVQQADGLPEVGVLALGDRCGAQAGCHRLAMAAQILVLHPLVHQRARLVWAHQRLLSV